MSLLFRLRSHFSHGIKLLFGSLGTGTKGGKEIELCDALRTLDGIVIDMIDIK